MNAARLLNDLLLPNRKAFQAIDGVWSVIPGDCGPARYDHRAAAYDWIVGNAIYNRLAWGASTDGYRAFAARAIDSGAGPLLDAGCGSACFTAQAYAQNPRPFILVDRSLSMLSAARQRLSRAAGGLIPGHVALLQADVLDLPFRPNSFETVLTMGMLHLFEDRPLMAFLRSLTSLSIPDGKLFLTSLVANRTIGRCYLALLHRAGEVATPRSFEQLSELLRVGLGESIEFERQGSMTYAAARTGSETFAAPAPSAAAD
jgi:ubiquinone/menaquinone biosynthesis C-methylase UbiE